MGGSSRGREAFGERWKTSTWRLRFTDDLTLDEGGRHWRIINKACIVYE